MSGGVENTPKLRFPEFSGEWKGEKLGKQTKKVGSGVTPKGGAAGYLVEGIPLLRSQNVRESYLDLTDVAFISPDVHRNMSGSAVQDGDVLLNITGASIGRSCVVPFGIGEANVNQHVCIIRLKDETSPAFVQTILASEQGQKLIFQSQAGGGREGLNFENIRNFRVALPKLPEQQKIAAFLGAVDAKIGQLTRKMALLEDYKKGCMQQLFAQKLRFKDDNGNDFPDWEVDAVSNLFSSEASRPYQILTSEIKDAGQFPVVDQGKERIRGFSDQRKKVFAASASPVIVFGDHTTELKYIDFDFVVGADGTKLLSPTTGNTKFLYYALSLNNVEQEGYKRHFSILKSVELPFPHPEEQKKIADFLSAIDAKISLVADELSEAQDFKKGLLQQMFV